MAKLSAVESQKLTLKQCQRVCTVDSAKKSGIILIVLIFFSIATPLLNQAWEPTVAFFHSGTNWIKENAALPIILLIAAGKAIAQALIMMLALYVDTIAKIYSLVASINMDWAIYHSYVCIEETIGAKTIETCGLDEKGTNLIAMGVAGTIALFLPCALCITLFHMQDSLKYLYDNHSRRGFRISICSRTKEGLALIFTTAIGDYKTTSKVCTIWLIICLLAIPSSYYINAVFTAMHLESTFFRHWYILGITAIVFLPALFFLKYRVQKNLKDIQESCKDSFSAIRNEVILSNHETSQQLEARRANVRDKIHTLQEEKSAAIIRIATVVAAIFAFFAIWDLAYTHMHGAYRFYGILGVSALTAVTEYIMLSRYLTCYPNVRRGFGEITSEIKEISTGIQALTNDVTAKQTKGLTRRNKRNH